MNAKDSEKIPILIASLHHSIRYVIYVLRTLKNAVWHKTSQRKQSQKPRKNHESRMFKVGERRGNHLGA